MMDDPWVVSPGAGVDPAAKGVGDFRRYRRLYDDGERDFCKGVEAFGLPFEECETQPRTLRCATEHRWDCRNGGASLVHGWSSPACKRCRTGEKMESFFISLRCPKHCWFCFNDNQEDFEYYRQHKRDIAAEIKQEYDDGRQLDFIALTGGEPCLFPDEVVGALEMARRCFPKCHIRLYSSGAAADEAMLERFMAAGLDEVRFSIKLDDSHREYKHLLDLIASCAPRMDTMVEMPVEPGSIERMKNILIDLDRIGVRGINLLELCYPLANAGEYVRRGLRIRRPPYRVLYDYWYAGKLPVAGSEAEALELLRFAIGRRLALGVHYCSLDNKNSGQVYQQNVRFVTDVSLQRAFPFHTFDEHDFFVKEAKVFGAECDTMHAIAQEKGVRVERAEIEVDGAPVGFFEMSCDDASRLHRYLPGALFATSLNMLEQREGDWVMREVDVCEVPEKTPDRDDA